MVALLGRGSIPRDELIEAVSNDTQLGSRAGVTGIAERLLQVDMAFAEIDGAVCYTPQLVDGTRWTIPVGADDIDRGFVRMHPAWSPLGWWLVADGADLVDASGDTIGRIETDGMWLGDDDPDVDVVVGPPGWLDAAVDGWMTLSVQSDRLQVTGCPTPPTATPCQIAAVQAGFERSVEVTTPQLLDGAHAKLATSTADQVLLAALLFDRDTFVDAPVPYLPHLLDAAGLEQQRTTVAPAGFDWSALEERRLRNRHQFMYGLGEREVDALTMLAGAFRAFSEEGDTALGATDDERDGAAILLAALAELDGVAEAFLAEAVSDAGDTGRVEAFVTALASRIDPDWPDGLGWIMSRCLLDRSDVRGSVELVERLADARVHLRSPAGGRRSDRLRPWRRADRDAPPRPRRHRRVTAVRGRPRRRSVHPRPRAQRARRGRVGGGHRLRPATEGAGRAQRPMPVRLGPQVQGVPPRQGTAHPAGSIGVAPRQGPSLRPHVLSRDPDRTRRRARRGRLRDQARAGLVTVRPRSGAPRARRVRGVPRRARGWLLPDDEVLLAQTWLLTDRAVFEILRDRADELHLRDVGSGETITVTNIHESDATRPGMYLIGRPVPVGDSYRAFSGFFPVAPHLVNPLIDAIDRDDVDEMMALLASTFRPPTLRNTSGEDLVFHTIRWSVDDPGLLSEELASAGFVADGDDRWTLVQDTPGMRRAIIATLRLDGTTLVSETNSDERAATVKALVADEVSSVHLLDDERREFDELDLPEGDGEPGGFDPDGPEVRALLDEMIRAKEIEWLDEQIPALSGRTPREAVSDPVGREDVRRLLATFPEPPPGDVGGFRASRLRAHLGLDD